MENKSYYQKTTDEVFAKLKSNEGGLSQEEAKKRLEEQGPNKLPEAKSDSLFVIYLRQFQSPLIFILIAAAIIVFLTGEKIDALVIMAVIFFNSIVGTVQEGKARNIFLALKKFVKTDASVFREKEEDIISDEKIVAGDVIALRAGEKVPADARVFYEESLQADEAALTGESSPKFKIKNPIKEDGIGVSDQKNMVFKGTNITSGFGKAIVSATGAQTVIGNISQKIGLADEGLPLKKNIRRFSHFIILAVTLISIFIFCVSFFIYNYEFHEIFSLVVATAVSIIPEGLPIVVTLVLATGVWRMGKRRVLIKKLQAVDALGQISVIAVDKTGTVTKNELRVKEIRTGDNLFLLDGVGYEPKGDIRFNGTIIEPLNHSELLLIGKICALGSSANLAYSRDAKRWKVSGDPTEAATLILAKIIGFNRDDLEKEMPVIDEVPFNYETRCHTTLHKGESENLLAVVGAPEKIIEISDNIWKKEKEENLNLEERENLKNIFLEMSSRGLRVLAMGIKKEKNQNKKIGKITNLTFIGFLGIEDAPKEEVLEAVNRVRSAGIKLAMITGDHIATARAIACQIGIFQEGDKTLNGREIEKMSEAELSEKLSGVSVFARVSPIAKLKIIRAYKAQGETVAMTGDGINDALSLSSADVGVAMGRIGTEVAKEAADIILLDDDFGSIVSGVEEGRNIYRTIKRVILYLFSTSLGEVLAIIGAIILGFPIPLLAAQILWLNLVTDGFLDVALAMEPNNHKTLSKISSRKRRGILDSFMVGRMFIMGITMAIGTLILFSNYYEKDLVKAWTISLTTLAVFQWFNAWNCRSTLRSIFNRNIFFNKYLLGATAVVAGLQVLALYNPYMRTILRTVPLSLKEWALIITVATSIILIEEVRKLIMRIWQTKKF